ncbi:hypothetical protein FQN54_003245 [Arachnomyces sp. PD_36]|nr:hypothetical protein FQN54_003245 [Arachnomyces sp. PD_36]
MPHKHKRRQKDDSTFDLPPTTIAKPLPARDPKKPAPKNNGSQQKQPDTARKPKRKSKANAEDDTPRAFARLMRLQQSGGRMPSGLDDGLPKKSAKKRKRGDEEGKGADSSNTATSKRATQDTAATSTDKIPKILPGERMSDFAARVNLALPLTGISKTRAQAPTEGPISKLREERQTKHERRLRRMQKEWREEEARIREKEEEEREEREAEEADKLDLWKEWEVEAGVKKKKGGKKGKKKRKGGGGAVGSDDDGVDYDDDDDDDPWAKIKKNREQPLNPLEVVQAPPEKLVKPREKFKVRGMGGTRVDVADVPAAAGSLKRREELAGERKSIVEEYRRIMAEKRM